MLHVHRHHGGLFVYSNPGSEETLLYTRDKGIHCCQVKIYCPDRIYSVTINMIETPKVGNSRLDEYKVFVS